MFLNLFFFLIEANIEKCNGDFLPLNYWDIDGETKRIEPKLKRHPMTILWIRFIEDGAISACTKSVKYFKINILKTSVKIDFGLKDPSSVSEKKTGKKNPKSSAVNLQFFFCLVFVCNFNCPFFSILTIVF